MGLAPVLVMLDLLDVVSGDSAGIAAEFVVVGTVAAETVAADTEMADSVAADTEIVDSVFVDIEIADFVFVDTGISDFVVADLHHIAICNALLLNVFHILGYCSCTPRCDAGVRSHSKDPGSTVFGVFLLGFDTLYIGMLDVLMNMDLCRESTTLLSLVQCCLKSLCRVFDWLNYSCRF